MNKGPAALTCADAATSVVNGAIDATGTVVSTAQQVARSSIKIAQSSAVGVAKGVKDFGLEVKAAALPRQPVPEALVEATTPEDRFFTPALGWQAAPAALDPEFIASACGIGKKAKYTPIAWRSPHHICPTEADVPLHFARSRLGAIGEVRVEVLQCDALPRLFPVGIVDPYALIVFEGFAACTHAHRNTRFPTWGVDSPRAVAFPVICPYSSVYVAINDSDANPFQADKPIGRVSIDLSQLKGRTVYDAWFALQFDQNAPQRLIGRRGAVRLRFSVVWNHDRVRLLAYPQKPPTFIVPIRSRKAMRSASFAVHGQIKCPSRFEWRAFNSQIRDLQAALTLVYSWVTAFLFWEGGFPRVLVNVAALILCQLLISYPFESLGMLPAALLMHLVLSYLTLPTPHPIEAKPTVCELCSTLLLGTTQSPITAEPSADDRSDGGGDGGGDGDDEDEGDEVGFALASEEEEDSVETEEEDVDVSEEESAPAGTNGLKKMRSRVRRVKAATVAKTATLGNAAASGGKAAVGGVIRIARSPITAAKDAVTRSAVVIAKASLPDFSVPPTLASELERIKWEVEEEVFLAARFDVDEDNADEYSVNPLASILGPVQKLLARANLYLRIGGRITTWDDPLLTFSVCVALALLSAALLWVGVLLHALPWSTIFEWTFRLLGLAVLGPHMYYVGQYVRHSAAITQQEHDEFAKADARKRKEILAQHRARMLEQARLRLVESTQREGEDLKPRGSFDARRADDAEEASDEEPSARTLHSRHTNEESLLREKNEVLREKNYWTLLNRSQPTAGARRHRCRADRTRSRAYPLYPSEDRPLLGSLEHDRPLGSLEA